MFSDNPVCIEVAGAAGARAACVAPQLGQKAALSATAAPHYSVASILRDKEACWAGSLAKQNHARKRIRPRVHELPRMHVARS